MSESHQAELAKNAFESLQVDLQARLESIDPDIQKKEDRWTREEGGGGTTLAFEQGTLIEKGGVNFSDVHGKSLPPSATQGRPELEGSPSGPWVCRWSFIRITRTCPRVMPTSGTSRPHLRERKRLGGSAAALISRPITQLWTRRLLASGAKTVCDKYGPGHYLRFKKWCDDYFCLPHRKETREWAGSFSTTITKEATTCRSPLQTRSDRPLVMLLRNSPARQEQVFYRGGKEFPKIQKRTLCRIQPRL